jgi:hypothetical protein
MFLSSGRCLQAKGAGIKGNPSPSLESAVEKLIKNNAGSKNAYAVFDWDNTSAYGDVQETLLIYQLENLEFKMTPEQFEYSFTHYAETGHDKNLEIPSDNFDKSYTNTDGKPLNIEIMKKDCAGYYRYFYNNYRKMNPAAKGNISLAELQKTAEYKDFVAKMWFTYAAIYKSFSVNAAYTWVMYITAPGYTTSEFHKMVQRGIDRGIKRESKKVYYESPAGIKSEAGMVSNKAVGNYFCNTIRMSPEMSSLFKLLKKNGIPVYISTASFQEIVDVVATTPKYGYSMPQNHVYGLRLKKDVNGRFLPEYDFSGNYTINSMDGKTININNILAAKYKSNPVMIGGDSDGDYSMITELSGLDGVKMKNNYSPLQLVLVLNRVKGGNIGKICKIAAAQLNGEKPGATQVVLQGRDENKGSWVPVEKTLKLGETGEDHFKLVP